jgi:hypothetical protein
LSLTLCSSARPADVDIAALVASCAQVRDAIKLSLDNDVLCFDGGIEKNAPLGEIRKLNSGGTFVARSQGGNVVVAMLIADILLEKNATVVLHDYCMSACANAFLVATHETRVAHGTIVAWHGGGVPNWSCAPIADIPKQQDEAAMNESGEIHQLYCRQRTQLHTFYKRRGITEHFVQRPQTLNSRKMFALLLRQGYDKRRALWMWHPENFDSYFKSKISFQSFPSSQDEVDERLRQLRFPIRVVYDPPDVSMIKGAAREVCPFFTEDLEKTSWRRISRKACHR